MEIVSSRNKSRYIFAVLLPSLLFLMVGSIFLVFGLQKHSFVGFAFFSILIGLAAGLHFIYNSRSPKIVLNKHGIFYRNHFYNREEILQIKLTGKGNLFLGAEAECMKLILKDRELLIFDNLYVNAPQMKYFVDEIIIHGKQTLERSPKAVTIIEPGGNFTAYKGNPILTFREVVILGWVIWMLSFPLYKEEFFKWKTYILILGFSSLLVLMETSHMYYFEISNNFFVVRNHYLFWRKKIYPISEIREITYENRYRQPISLRIITKRYENKLYPAASLSRKTWLDMAQDFENKNITVINKSIW